MTPFEWIVKSGTTGLATAIEAAGAVVIAFAVVTTVVRWLRALLTPAAAEAQTRLALVSLGTWLSFALEFEVAADILRTAVAPSWNDIGQLSAIIVLRSALNYVLRSESGHLVRTLTVPAPQRSYGAGR
ncbi:MAG TPA: DUF1622 domain-containing protein [Candidatus Acidoferrum sp.]|nr:DUF1622 domain-containing protein [Candidatus Acidoferrum sp.]